MTDLRWSWKKSIIRQFIMTNSDGLERSQFINGLSWKKPIRQFIMTNSDGLERSQFIDGLERSQLLDNPSWQLRWSWNESIYKWSWKKPIIGLSLKERTYLIRGLNLIIPTFWNLWISAKICTSWPRKLQKPQKTMKWILPKSTDFDLENHRKPQKCMKSTKSVKTGKSMKSTKTIKSTKPQNVQKQQNPWNPQNPWNSRISMWNETFKDHLPKKVTLIHVFIFSGICESKTGPNIRWV